MKYILMNNNAQDIQKHDVQIMQMKYSTWISKHVIMNEIGTEKQEGMTYLHAWSAC